VSDEEQRLAIEKNYPMFSRPMDHTEFLAQLEPKPKAASSSVN
jgi:ureidoacrylate peracid hydrolase